MKTTNNQLRHLEDKHRLLDNELGQLTNRVHLTPTEYEQALELKKRKLQLKDGIAALLQRER
jgi:uncharacterized protein YdcH (DUF465 family)